MTDLSASASAVSFKSLSFRPPSSSSASTPQTQSSFEVPPIPFLSGPWHVTHSTLPMWKSNRNVVITYTPIEGSDCIDDLVTYQSISSESLKTVRGVDTPHPSIPVAYNWRGKGWLKIASSQWELLGWGTEEEGWVVTYFQKTLFTPAGLDVYARKKGGLSEEMLERIKEKMKNLGAEDDGLKKMVDGIFEVKHDWQS